MKTGDFYRVQSGCWNCKHAYTHSACGRPFCNLFKDLPNYVRVTKSAFETYEEFDRREAENLRPLLLWKINHEVDDLGICNSWEINDETSKTEAD